MIAIGPLPVWHFKSATVTHRPQQWPGMNPGPGPILGARAAPPGALGLRVGAPPAGSGGCVRGSEPGGPFSAQAEQSAACQLEGLGTGH